MYLSNYQLSKKKETTVLIFLFLISAIARIPIILLYGDTTLDNEWGILVNNLITHNTLAFDYHDKNLREFLLPSVFMPPLYSYYLYIFSFLNLEIKNYIQVILFSQILLSSLSIVIFYKINKIFFSSRLSFFGSILFSLVPLHLYACSQISSITLQTFFTILFFYFFFKLIEKKFLIFSIYLSLIGGLLLLLRGEFVAILFLSIFLLIFLFKLNFKYALTIILITFITASPYLIRNIVLLNEISITKSFGYNLWKGNNENSKVEGSEKVNSYLRNKINEIPKNKYYGVNFDQIFLEEAKKNIKENPTKYLILYFEKFFSFLLVDINSSHPKYFNPLHFFPVLLLSITSIIGIVVSNKKSNKLNYLIMVFFLNIIIFSFFFILPRYKLVILPMQIIFTNVLIDYIRNKFFSSNEQ